MAAGIGNTNGHVSLFDGGNPRIVTAKARENISGGAFVFCSGADAVVTADASSFAFGDIEVATDASGAQFNGIALQSVASGGVVSVVTRGHVIVPSYGTVTAGYFQMCEGTNAVANLGSVAGNLSALRSIGRAWTSAGSGEYTVLELK